jgi:hypothetical protein
MVAKVRRCVRGVGGRGRGSRGRGLGVAGLGIVEMGSPVCVTVEVEVVPVCS